MGNPAPETGPMDPQAQAKENPVPVTSRPTADEPKPPSPPQRELERENPSPPQRENDNDEVQRDVPQPRRSSRTRKQVDRFKFDKAHGYSNVKKFLGVLINCFCVFHSVQRVYDANYVTALALDPTHGILDGFSNAPPDFLNRNPWMFKAKTKNDPDTPGIKEALSGKYRTEFLQGMANEITELENHDTWELIKKSDIKPIKDKNGKETLPPIVPLTWAFKIKRWPNGILRKIKARICVRGDLQDDLEDPFETYAPVASWASIRMLTILTLQQKWVTKQIDFSNAFVQAPLKKDVYVSLPAMFEDESGINPNDTCLKLKKSLYGMKEAPKLWADFLSKALVKAGFEASAEDLGIYYGRGMAIAVYVDDVLFFGPNEDEMEKVIDELQTDGFELKREKNGDDTAFSFLGIELEEKNGEIKLTQHG